MAKLIGLGHIFSMTGGALGITALSGYISPNLTTLKVKHGAEVDRIRAQTGDTASAIYSDEYLECTFDFIPEGTTIANAILSAGIPPAGSGVTITGLPIIHLGPFTDGLNTNAANTQPWIYEADGNQNGNSEKKWDGSMTLRRYIGITSATAVT